MAGLVVVQQGSVVALLQWAAWAATSDEHRTGDEYRTSQV